MQSLIDPKFEQHFQSLDKVGIDALRLRTVMAAITNIFCHSKDVASCGKAVGRLAKQLTNADATRELSDDLVQDARNLLDVVEPPALSGHERLQSLESLLAAGPKGSLIGSLEKFPAHGKHLIAAFKQRVAEMKALKAWIESVSNALKALKVQCTEVVGGRQDLEKHFLNIDSALQLCFETYPHMRHALLQDQLPFNNEQISEAIENALFSAMNHLAKAWLDEAYKQSQKQELGEAVEFAKLATTAKASCSNMRGSTVNWLPKAVDVASFTETWFRLSSSNVFTTLPGVELTSLESSGDSSAAQVSNADIQALVRLGDVLRGPHTLQCFLQEAPELLSVREWYSKNIEASATQRSEHEKKGLVDAMRSVHDKAKALFEAADLMTDDIQASTSSKGLGFRFRV